MARRKSQPAPPLVKWFWGGAIAAAVLLGPLLFLRADWMWSKNLSLAEGARALSERSTAEAVRARMRIDALRGEPFVAHVVVALADNVHQGITPVAATLADGDAPQSNLFWGAPDGLRSYLERRGSWRLAGTLPTPREEVLERVVFADTVTIDGVEVEAFVVADAWRGSAIEEATAAFLRVAAGHDSESLTLEGRARALRAGGSAHLVAWIGHDGLMDFELPALPEPRPRADPRSAVVLAASSESHFVEPLRALAAHPLLLTTGDMTPDAGTFDRALRSWWSDPQIESVHEAAAAAYAEIHGLPIEAARRLFVTLPR